MVVAVLMGGVGVFNFFMDPFNLQKEHFFQYDRYGYNGKFNHLLWAMVKFSRLDEDRKGISDVIILGDSRGVNLTHGKVLSQFQFDKHYNIYNLSIDGSTLDESIEMFYEENNKIDFKNLKSVILTIPFTKFFGKFGQLGTKRIEEANKFFSNPFSYYLNYDIFKRSVINLYQLATSTDKKEKNKSTAPLQIKKAVAMERSPKPQMGKTENFYKIYVSGRYGPRVFETKLKKVEKFIKYLELNNINVILWSPPVQYDLVTLKNDKSTMALYNQYKTRLKSLARFYDFFMDKDRYNIDFKYSKDMIHNNNSDELLKVLLLSEP